jgi:transposase
MHAMWRDGTFYASNPDATEHDVNAANAAKLLRLSYARS